MDKFYQIAMAWVQQIRPWVTNTLENHPYIVLVIIAFIWLITALIQRHKKKSKAKSVQNQKKNPVPNGGYTNFKGEVWYPDGRKWNQDTQKWETANYTEEETQPTEQS